MPFVARYLKSTEKWGVDFWNRFIKSASIIEFNRRTHTLSRTATTETDL